MKKKTVALLTAMALAMTMMIGTATVSVGAKTSYELPSKATSYYNESFGENAAPEDAKWKKSGTTTFKYNKNGNITYADGLKSVWKYKNKKPLKVTAGSKKARGKSVATYKNGKLKKVKSTFYNKKGKVVLRSTEKVSYKKGWIVKHTEKKDRYTYKTTVKYKFHANKVPKQMNETAKLAGATYKNNFTLNDKGLVTKWVAKTSLDNYDPTTEKYKYKYDEKGRVIERYTYSWGELSEKTVFTYSGAKTSSRKAYIAAINYNILNTVGVRDMVPRVGYSAK